MRCHRVPQLFPKIVPQARLFRIYPVSFFLQLLDLAQLLTLNES